GVVAEDAAGAALDQPAHLVGDAGDTFHLDADLPPCDRSLIDDYRCLGAGANSDSTREQRADAVGDPAAGAAVKVDCDAAVADRAGIGDRPRDHVLVSRDVDGILTGDDPGCGVVERAAG